jgi:hypothetical protein
MNDRTGMSKREGPPAGRVERAVQAWPPWFEWCFLIGLVIGGVAIDWYCAFEWFSRRFSLNSEPVFYRMAPIVLSCASIGLLASFPRGGKWQVGVVMFFFASVTVSGNILLWWVGHR